MKKIFLLIIFIFLILPLSAKAETKKCCLVTYNLSGSLSVQKFCAPDPVTLTECQQLESHYQTPPNLNVQFVFISDCDDGSHQCAVQAMPATASPSTSKTSAKWTNPFDNLQITIPGMQKFSEPKPCADDPSKMCVNWIGEYIAGVYNYGINIIGILAALILMLGGVIWLLAGSNASKIGEAKAWIAASVSGLVIALASYAILYQINPNLVIFKPLKIKMVEEIPLDQLSNQYASMGCPSETEKIQGFKVLATGYCKPQSSNYKTRKDFLCMVGLNCDCPKGRSSTRDCTNSGKSFYWSSCLDFDEKTVPYCNKTASGATPAKGQVAADWGCFPQKSYVCIGSDRYKVTDIGKAIHGRRFDIWSNSCQEAMQVTGEYTVKVCN